MGKATVAHPERQAPPERIPPLQAGDRLTRDEFERRYEAMPELKKAELIEGVVHVPSPVNHDQHGRQHLHINGWLSHYIAATPGVDAGCESTVRLDWDNEPQPDSFLRILPSHGGQSRTTPDGYIEGAPEFIAEVAATSASYDLHAKLGAYRRNGVREYLVWRVLDQAIDWFVLRGGQYEKLPADAAGVLKSETFPGLWLDPAALLRGDLAAVLKLLSAGLESPGHADFVARIEKARTPA